MLPTTYTVEQVAESLGVTAWWVRRQIKAGVVNPLRVGDHPSSPIRFTQADVDHLIESMRPAVVEPTRKRRRRRAS